MNNKIQGKMNITLFFLCSINVYSLDTLYTEIDYPSPILNPIAIEYFNDYFWIANLIDTKVYKLNSDMILLDSIETYHSRICGIYNEDNFLWISVDEPVVDVVTQSNFISYRIYKIDIELKTIIDSLLFKISGVNPDTGLIFGLEKIKDTFVISLNMGFSSGIYSIYSEETEKILKYLPLSGLTVISNELWGIRRKANGRNGNKITSLTNNDSLAIQIDVNGTDIAYDEKNIFVCNSDQSKIHKLMTLEVSLRNIKRQSKNGKSQSLYRLISFIDEKRPKNKIISFTLKGQNVRYLQNKNQGFASQIIIDINRNALKCDEF